MGLCYLIFRSIANSYHLLLSYYKTIPIAVLYVLALYFYSPFLLFMKFKISQYYIFVFYRKHLSNIKKEQHQEEEEGLLPLKSALVVNINMFMVLWSIWLESNSHCKKDVFYEPSQNLYESFLVCNKNQRTSWQLKPSQWLSKKELN